MNKTVLLAAAAALALTAGGASAAQHPSAGVVGSKVTPVVHKAPAAKMLYNQNSNSSGVGLVSDNFTSGSFSTYDDSGADDFVVPKGRQWTVTQVDVTGQYFNGSGPATAENVIFYKDAGGKPGPVVKNGTFSNISCSASPNFSCALGKGVKLKSGGYWVAVVANMNFSGGKGEWGWDINSTIHGNPAMWQNPGGGFGVCPTWGTIGSCLGYTGDFMFDLQGKSKKK